METSEELNMTADEDVEKQEQREDKLFQKQLERQFEDTRFCTADKMKLPKGNSTGSLALDISPRRAQSWIAPGTSLFSSFEVQIGPRCYCALELRHFL